jgi:hypothetical protein
LSLVVHYTKRFKRIVLIFPRGVIVSFAVDDPDLPGPVRPSRIRTDSCERMRSAAG